MTTDDILRMAREAGMRLDKHSGGFVRAAASIGQQMEK